LVRTCSLSAANRTDSRANRLRHAIELTKVAWPHVGPPKRPLTFCLCHSLSGGREPRFVGTIRNPTFPCTSMLRVRLHGAASIWVLVIPRARGFAIRTRRNHSQSARSRPSAPWTCDLHALGHQWHKKSPLISDCRSGCSRSLCNARVARP